MPPPASSIRRRVSITATITRAPDSPPAPPEVPEAPETPKALASAASVTLTTRGRSGPPGNAGPIRWCDPPSTQPAAAALNGPTSPEVSAHRPQYTTRIGRSAIGGTSRIGLRTYDRK